MSDVLAVTFDLYGTLIDIKTDENRKEVWDALARFLEYYRLDTDGPALKEEYDRAKKDYLLGRTEGYPEVDIEAAFSDVLRQKGTSDRALTVACCKLFRLLTRERIGLFPDVLPVLEELQSEGYALALVSNAQRVFTRDEVRMLRLDRFFRYDILSTDFGFAKPDPRLFSIACDLLGVAPGAAVYIGDNPEHDIPGPRQTGMRTVLLNRARKPLNEKAQPDFIADDLWKALEWIRQQ